MRFRTFIYRFCFMTLPIGIIVLPGCKSSSSEKSLDDAKKESANNLRQIALGMLNYESVHRTFPGPGSHKEMKVLERSVSPFSWRVEILPYIDHTNLYNQIPGLEIPETVSNTEVKIYQNPMGNKGRPTDTHYRVFVGNGAAFEWGKELSIHDFKDKLAKTILVVESAEPISWASLDDFNYDPKKPLPKLGIFPDGFFAAMGDGQILWIPSDTSEKTIRGLIERDGEKSFSETPGKSEKK